MTHNVGDVLYVKNEYQVAVSDEIDVNYCGADYEVGYTVTNTSTDIVEFMTPSLPDAINLANQSSAALNFFRYAEDEAVDVGILESTSLEGIELESPDDPKAG